MPVYQYHCSSCDVLFETFETMTENAELPTPHCPKCDPDQEIPTTVYKYFGNCRPAFDLKEGHGGFYKPGWQ